MDPRIFKLSNKFPGLYFVDCESSLPNSTVGCIFPNDIPTGSSMSLNNIFQLQNAGYTFFFVPRPISSSSQAAFGQNLKTYLGTKTNVGFQWIYDPSTLKTTSNAGPAIQVTYSPGKTQTPIKINSTFPFNNIHFVVSTKCYIALPGAQDTTIQVKQNSANAAYFATNFGKTKQSVIPQDVAIQLPFCGQYAGTWQMSAKFQTGNATPDTASFDMSIKVLLPYAIPNLERTMLSLCL